MVTEVMKKQKRWHSIEIRVGKLEKSFSPTLAEAHMYLLLEGIN